MDAINAAFPDTTVQTCIVHLVRHSLNFCGWKDRKEVAKSLKRIYQATDDVEAGKALDDFEAGLLPKFCCTFCSHRRSPFAHNMRLKERHNSATGPR